MNIIFARYDSNIFILLGYAYKSILYNSLPYYVLDRKEEMATFAFMFFKLLPVNDHNVSKRN